MINETLNRAKIFKLPFQTNPKTAYKTDLFGDKKEGVVKLSYLFTIFYDSKFIKRIIFFFYYIKTITINKSSPKTHLTKVFFCLKQSKLKRFLENEKKLMIFMSQRIENERFMEKIMARNGMFFKPFARKFAF